MDSDSSSDKKTSPDQSSDKEKSLREENESLKAELKELEKTMESAQIDLSKSVKMRERFESLAKELENRTKEIKAESHAKIQEAEDQSKDLASTVTSNMAYMQDINQSLHAVSSESLLVYKAYQCAKKENEDLAAQIGILKTHYDEREKKLNAALTEAHNSLIATQTELAQMKLKNAEDKERLFGEMEKVAHGLVESKQQMKDAKETELGLRILLKKYDDKFGGLQASLQETNSAYDCFREEMEKMGSKTKELEKEAVKWQMRWEESNDGLLAMSKNHEVLQNDLHQVHDKLTRMTNLCKALQKEIKELESQLEAKK